MVLSMYPSHACPPNCHLHQMPQAIRPHLLEVRPLKVDGRQRQLVLDRLCQLLVVLHQLCLVAHLVGAVEQDARLKWTARALHKMRDRRAGCCLGIIIRFISVLLSIKCTAGFIVTRALAAG